ncbi:hypothetical protein BH11PSE10_BH11PSE10_05120 [soil metagenome]
MKIGMSPDVAAAPVGADKPGTAAAAGRQASSAAPATAAGSAAPAKKAPEASAQIALSSAATTLLSGVPEDGSFDIQKVGRISQAISDGKFTVNADVIADKLIANAQEVLGRRQPH